MREIREMYAVVFTHPAQGEGIPSVRDSMGNSHIMADSDPERVRQFMPEIRRLAREAGLPFKIVKFGGREDVTDQF